MCFKKVKKVKKINKEKTFFLFHVDSCFYASQMCLLRKKKKLCNVIQVHLNKLECRGKVHLFQ